MCTTFSTAASKYEFLDLAYPMMERLTAVTQIGPPVRPSQTSQIKTNFRAEFSHALEPWVGMSKLAPRPQEPPTPAERLYETQPQPSAPMATSPPQTGGAYFHPPTSRRQHSALRAKALEGEGPFPNHCRSFDSQVKELSQQLSALKEQLQNLHREVISHKPAPGQNPQMGAQGRLEMIARDCSNMEEQLERHQVELERLKNVFDTIWEEQLCRIHVEKDIFQSQVCSLLCCCMDIKNKPQ